MAGPPFILPEGMLDDCACAYSGGLHGAPILEDTSHSQVTVPNSVEHPLLRGFGRPAAIGSPLEKGLHLAFAGDIFCQRRNLKQLEELYTAASGAQPQRPAGEFDHVTPLFSQGDAVHLDALREFREQNLNGNCSLHPKIAAASIRSTVERCLDLHKLPFDSDWWEFVFQDRVYDHKASDGTVKLFTIRSAHSCGGMLTLWHVPQELELFFFNEKLYLQDKLQGTYTTQPRTSPDLGPADPTLHKSRFYHSSVTPADLPQLLQLLRALGDKCDSQQTDSGKPAIRLSAKVMMPAEQATFPLVSLRLHADPTGILVHPNNVILLLPGKELKITCGSCLSARHPLDMPLGSTVILIDNLHIPTFERRGGPSWPPAEVRLRNLYISGNDYLSVTKFVRIKAPGFSAIPKTNCNHVNGVISALLMYLKGYNLDLNIPAGPAVSHASTLDWVSRQEQTFACQLARARYVKQWWTQLTSQQQQQLIAAHKSRGTDVNHLLTRLGAATIRSSTYHNALQHLYTAVIPASDRELAEAENPMLKGVKQHQQQKHAVMPYKNVSGTVSLLHDHSDTASLASAGMALHTAVGSSYTAASGTEMAHRLTPDRALHRVASATAAANGSDEAAAADLQEDSSPSNDQPRRKQKTSTSTAVAIKQSPATPATRAIAAMDAGASMLLPAAAGGLARSPAQVAVIPDVRHTAFSFMNGGKRPIVEVLKQHQSQPAAAPAIISLGQEFKAAIDSMVLDGALLLEGVDPSGKQCVLAERAIEKQVYVWRALANVEYNGTRLQYDPETAQELVESGVIVSSYHCKSSSAEFEAACEQPYILIESKYKEAGSNGNWRIYPKRGDACLDVEVFASSKDELAQCRMALFHVTVVLMLLWHGQHKQKHAALQEIAARYKLNAVAPQKPTAPTQDTTDKDAAKLGKHLRGIH